MDITLLKRGERGIVQSVSSAAPLKERLRSLNIRPGASVLLVKTSFFKKTFLVQAGGSLIALRKEVATCVSVKKA